MWRGTKEPLDEGEGEKWKNWLKTKYLKNKNKKPEIKIMASSPITVWQIELEKVKVVIDLLLLGSKITADADCSHEIRRWLLLGRKALTNLVCWKAEPSLLTKVHRVKAIVFPVVMYGCESWTIKKAESQRTDAFKLWCWRRLLKGPWAARRSNQSILKEINIQLEGLNIHWKDWCWS